MITSDGSGGDSKPSEDELKMKIVINRRKY
jgi:hypothetical protein